MIAKILKKIKTPKKRSNRPMIQRTASEEMYQEAGISNKFSARQRLRKMGSDTSLQGQAMQMGRYFKKASPKKKALIIGATIAPKAAFVGAGYYMTRQDDKE